ncbi:2Fe-2S iron-sulfur cluster-binding protein [Plantactinospora sp. WMMB334]|uniref:2Fe-2S iron-sulfur cluster-binding protein n=1 Tax=Plantactinospora sp. WMMB334 TaxID=3404119 RepID=UPI003B93DCD1
MDGEPVSARAGQTLAAALLASGCRTLRRTRFAGRPRGVFCGIGVCFDCVVVCNGVPGVRACLRPAEPGDVVDTGRHPATVAGAGRRPTGVTGTDEGSAAREEGSAGRPTRERSGAVAGSRAVVDGRAVAGIRAVVDGRAVAGSRAAAGGSVRLAVVGAGPAGLAAAVAAAEAGAEVVVVDLGRRPGGQYLRQSTVAAARPLPVVGGRGGRATDHGRPATSADRIDLLRRATRNPRITIHPGQQVWSAEATGAGAAGEVILRLLGPAGPTTLAAPAVVLAPGGYDRVVPFPGWDLPGVVTAGGAQALAKGQGVLVGRRVLVAGTGPFLLVVAAGLAAAGARVAGVVEAAPLRRWVRHPVAVAAAPGRLAEAARLLVALRRHRVPLWRGQAVTEVRQDGADLAATVRRVDAGWRAGPVTRSVTVDAVCVGHGFTPSVELAVALGCATRTDPADGSLVVTVDELGRSGVPGVLVAGEATGVGGAALAAAEGHLAGLAAAHRLGLLTDTELTRAAAPVLRRAARQRRFAAATHRVHRVPDREPEGWPGWLRPETVLCRCEEVTAGRLRADVTAYGLDDIRALKLVTRVGMGLCQGRICGRAAAVLLGAACGRDQPLEDFATRQIALPVPLGAVAEEGPPL